MIKPPVPKNEKERLKALHSYHILDTFREEEYDRLTELASRICGTPISLVTLIDEKRQWIKSSYGMDITDTPREESICQYTIMDDQLLEISDTTKDERFSAMPGIAEPEGDIKFYAGFPLIDKQGHALGALCVLDHKPNQLTKDQLDTLKLLSETIVSLIAERRKTQELDHFEQLFELSNDLICIAGLDGYYKRVNPAFTKILGWSEAELMQTPMLEFVHPDDRVVARNNLSGLIRGKDKITFTRRFLTKEGGYRILQWAANPQPDTGYIFAIGRDITEERAREELLEESQQKLSAFFDHSQGLMSTHEVNGNFISVNAAGAGLLGYTVAELNSMNLRDIIPAKHHASFEKYLEHIAEKGKASGQMTTLHKDGSRRIWMFSNFLEKGTNETPYIIANAIDITDRFNLEKDLARTKEMLEQTNNVARVGGWVAETAKEKIYWTDQTKDMMGVPRDFEPDLQSTIACFKKGESQNAVIRAINSALHTGQSWDMEVKIVTPAGEEKWVRMQGHADFEEGTAKRLYGAFQDIDEKKRSELEILNSRKLLQEVLQSASEVSIVATDKNGIITLFNKGAERMLGYTAEEMIGTSNAFKLHDPDEVKARERELKLETGEDITGMRAFVFKTERDGSEQREWAYVKKDGSRCMVSLVMTPIRDIRNNVVGYLGIATDITKRKRMEEALIAAKQQAEQVSNAKSEFLANMSHEIRTPLNGIIGFTDLVMKTELDENQQQYLQIVHQSANVLLSIINDILDLSKIEAGKLDLNVERSSLRELGREALDIISFQAKTKGLDVVLDIRDDLPQFIYADALRLKQVLVNLLGNAVKFTEAGKVELRISTMTDAKNHQITFKFEVRDTGIGIKPDKQEKIFEAFAQEDASTTKKYGGTGIGLAISNKLLALMGSKLQLISYPGTGSIFYFYVKLRADHAVQGAGETPAKLVSRTADALKDLTCRVLIVEDNTVNMMLTRAIVKKLMPKARIIEAVDGMEAVQICRKSIPDIILMDIQIPVMNGYEATHKIRHLEMKGRVPIIALTAGNISGERQKSFDAGMDDFLSKPIVEASLDGMFRKWLVKEIPSQQQTDTVELGARADASEGAPPATPASDSAAVRPRTTVVTASAASRDAEHFDIEVLKKYMGDENVGSYILQLTYTELEKAYVTLKEYVEGGDLKGIKAIGHKLYGTTSTVGMPVLSQLARTFDQLESYVPAKIGKLLAETSAELRIVLKLLRKYIEVEQAKEI